MSQIILNNRNIPKLCTCNSVLVNIQEKAQKHPARKYNTASTF